jgi:hypothetical protein
VNETTLISALFIYIFIFNLGLTHVHNLILTYSNVLGGSINHHVLDVDSTLFTLVWVMLLLRIFDLVEIGLNCIGEIKALFTLVSDIFSHEYSSSCKKDSIVTYMQIFNINLLH